MVPDPRLLREFLLAESARALLAWLKWPVEPWVTLRLARTESEFLRREVDRLARLQDAGRAASLGGLLADSVDRVVRIMGRRAQELRRTLGDSGVMMDLGRLELVLAVFLRDGASSASEAEIRRRALEVESYLSAPESGGSEEAKTLPEGVDAELLEDLRH